MTGGDRFIPRRVGQITADLAEVGPGDAPDVDALRAFSRLVSALYHLEVHEREQWVVEQWDRVGDDPGAAVAVREALEGLLRRANYVELGMDELRAALARESLIPLRLEVDLDDYDDLLVFRRGGECRSVEVRRWLGLRTERRRINVLERVVVLTRVKPVEHFRERGRDPAERNLVPGHVSLKQFQDVPLADIEMLLPSTRVRLRPVDSLLVGVPAVASGIAVLATKLLPTIGLMFVLAGAWLGLRDEEPELDQGALVALTGGLVTLGGFLVRQWSKLKNRRVRYLKTLSETLYFRTLADGPGVLHTLFSVAEQQEVVEVLLAHRFLSAAPDGLTGAELDATIERWLRATCHREIDFDVGGALAKLESLGIASGDDRSGRWRALPLPEAVDRLHRRWDGLFAPDVEPAAPVPQGR